MYFAKGNWIGISNSKVLKVPWKGFCANFQKNSKVLAVKEKIHPRERQHTAAHIILPLCLAPVVLVWSLACSPTAQVNWVWWHLVNYCPGPAQLAGNCNQQLSTDDAQQLSMIMFSNTDLKQTQSCGGSALWIPTYILLTQFWLKFLLLKC